MAEWISVKDRLPDGECIAGCFQTYTPCYKEMIIGYIEKVDDHYEAENDYELLQFVTHWMPLPEPPKEITT